MVCLFKQKQRGNPQDTSPFSFVLLVVVRVFKFSISQHSQMSTKPDIALYALSAGHFTLPEWQFIHPISRSARKTVPSLAFLIQHRDLNTSKTTSIVFDLGLRRDVRRYYPPIQKHIETRQPMTTEPDVVESLAKGGLGPQNVDFVIYSHVCSLPLFIFTLLAHRRRCSCSGCDRCTGIILASPSTSPPQPLW
jgi:hypothetical protein